MKPVKMSAVIKNLNEFEELLEDTRSKAKLLEESLNKLKSFDFEIETSTIAADKEDG